MMEIQHRCRLVAFFVLGINFIDAFVSPQRTAFSRQSRWNSNQPEIKYEQHGLIQPSNGMRGGGSTGTELYSFMGSDGGILGIGTPELFTILLVGYFVLGPSDLYKLTKEIGKFVQNFRTFSTEATAQFENNMENNLQLEEIRKAQRELNDAFSFRRSINVEEEMEAFEVNAQSPRMDAAPTVASETAAAVAATAPKKKIRRRVKKKVATDASLQEPALTGEMINQGTIQNDIPSELSAADEAMSEAEKRMMESLQASSEELRKDEEAKGLASANERREAYLERLKSGQPNEGASTSVEDAMAAQELANSEGAYDFSTDENANARFQAQLDAQAWNDQILSKEDELSPLADIMDRLALLEEEKNAADMRLQEEFKLREENEEKFYKEKRKLLEEAAAKVQTEAYAVKSDEKSMKNSTSTTATATTK